MALKKNPKKKSTMSKTQTEIDALESRIENWLENPYVLWNIPYEMYKTVIDREELNEVSTCENQYAGNVCHQMSNDPHIPAGENIFINGVMYELDEDNNVARDLKRERELLSALMVGHAESHFISRVNRHVKQLFKGDVRITV